MNEDLELMMSEIPANMTMADVEDYLCHYGVKDQKRGVRRYQNLDGSLTPLGRLHYGIGFKNIGQVEAARRAKEKAKKEKEEDRRKKEEAKKAEAEAERQRTVEKAIKSGDPNEIYKLRETMTDQELSRAVQRMNSTQALQKAMASTMKKEEQAQPQTVKEPRKSIFDKKKEKAQKEKEERAAREKAIASAIESGTKQLATLTKAANTIIAAKNSYDSIKGMLPESKKSTGSGSTDFTYSTISSGASIIDSILSETGKYEMPKDSSKPFTFEPTNFGVHMYHTDQNFGEVLCHYGRKDQKWGVRRYQNLDGSLTPEGRERYRKLRNKFDMDSPNATNKKKTKQLETAVAVYRQYDRALSKMPKNPTDERIRQGIENAVDPIINPYTAAWAYGGAMLLGPVGAVATATARANTIKADVSNKVVLGREVIDRYLNDPDSYNVAVTNLSTVDRRYLDTGREFCKNLMSPKSVKHSEFLCHYGIMGQKWGIRRFQNEDGVSVDFRTKMDRLLLLEKKDIRKHGLNTAWTKTLPK